MSYTPLPKAAKPAWVNQLTRLERVKFQFVYTTWKLLCSAEEKLKTIDFCHFVTFHPNKI